MMQNGNKIPCLLIDSHMILGDNGIDKLFFIKNNAALETLRILHTKVKK